MRERRGTVAALVGGIAALVIGIVSAWNEALLEAIVTPPTIVRAVLIAREPCASAALLAAAAAHLAAGDSDNPERDLPGVIRGAPDLLAVAAFAAAAGWALAHPLPLVVALVIAAIDVIETSFLLLVDPPPPPLPLCLPPPLFQPPFSPPSSCYPPCPPPSALHPPPLPPPPPPSFPPPCPPSGLGPTW